VQRSKRQRRVGLVGAGAADAALQTVGDERDKEDGQQGGVRLAEAATREGEDDEVAADAASDIRPEAGQIPETDRLMVGVRVKGG